MSHELRIRLMSQAPILEQLLDPVTGQFHIKQTIGPDGNMLHFLVPNLQVDGDEEGSVVISSSKVHVNRQNEQEK